MADEGTQGGSQHGARPALVLEFGKLDVPDFGVLWLTWSERGLAGISWTEPGREDAVLVRTAQVPADYRTLLEQYFQGRPVDPATLRADVTGTPFQLKVWRALRSIRRGQVRTYAQIAVEVGSPRGARAVGAASKANRLPVVIPCHRVVNTGMGLGGYSGGLERKRKLLALEGVRTIADVVHPGQLELSQFL